MRPAAPDALRVLSRQRARLRTQRFLAAGAGFDWTSLPLANGWTADAAGAQYTAAYGRVVLRGNIAPGTATHAADLAVATTLTASVAPGATELALASTVGLPNSGTVLVGAAGSVFSYTSVSDTGVGGSYSGASWPAGTGAWGGAARPGGTRGVTLWAAGPEVRFATVDAIGRLTVPTLEPLTLDPGRYVT